jgi:hypothetical protein
MYSRDFRIVRFAVARLGRHPDQRFSFRIKSLESLISTVQFHSVPKCSIPHGAISRQLYDTTTATECGVGHDPIQSERKLSTTRDQEVYSSLSLLGKLIGRAHILTPLDTLPTRAYGNSVTSQLAHHTHARQ